MGVLRRAGAQYLARRTIFLGRYEASQFASPCIESEHLLLGLREDIAKFAVFLCLILSLKVCLVAQQNRPVDGLWQHRRTDAAELSYWHTYLNGLADHCGRPWLCYAMRMVGPLARSVNGQSAGRMFLAFRLWPLFRSRSPTK